jgi:hypothetical protein
MHTEAKSGSYDRLRHTAIVGRDQLHIDLRSSAVLTPQPATI